MTVLSELSKVAYIGNSSQVLYPIPFEYINIDNIYVSVYTDKNEFVENWTYSNQYIIENSNVKVLSGFEIDNTKKLLIIRVIDAVQDNRYREGGDFPAKSTETSFDKLTMLIQQHQEVLDRCVKVEVLDNQTPEELLAEVYSKLDSATDVANDAIAAAEQATVAAENATTAVEVANKTLINTQEYVASAKEEINQTKTSAKEEIATTVSVAKQDINNTVEAGKQDINSTIDDASMRLSDTIEESVEEVKAAALETAQEAINSAAAEVTAIVVDYTNNEIKPELVAFRDSADEDARAAEDWANTSKIWATGEDAEVETVAPGEQEHSSRGYADLAMAIANTPEDVPVDTSTLLALDVIRGPKGDSGEAEFSGDVSFEGSFNVHGDDNHPVKVTSMAGTSASGYQVVDSNGLGDSDFEHYATGDRYGTRITNHNNTSNTSVSVDLYQSNVGKSVLDLSDVETILAPALLKAIYPVGSIYIATAATCPMQELGAGTWEIVGTSLVTSVDTNAPVKGTGITLGLTDGTNNYGMASTQNSWRLNSGANFYGVNVGTVNSSYGTQPANNIAMGVTTDSSKSGMTSTVTRSTITANIFRRIS